MDRTVKEGRPQTRELLAWNFAELHNNKSTSRSGSDLIRPEMSERTRLPSFGVDWHLRNLAITQTHHRSLTKLWGWAAVGVTTQAKLHGADGEAS